MKITNFAAMTEDERSAAFAAMDNDALAAALSAHQEQGATLFALETPTVEQVQEASALVASRRFIQAEVTARAAAVEAAAAEFAAARAEFAGEPVNDGVEEGEGDEGAEDPADEGEGDAGDEGDEGAEGDAGEGDAGDAGEGEAVTAAAVDHTRSQRVPAGAAARKVAARVKRPAKASRQPVTITAAADVPGYAASAPLNGMVGLAKASINRAKGFSPHSEAAAVRFRESTGKDEDLHKFGVASLGIDFPDSLVASGSADDEYRTMKDAIADHSRALNAAMNSDKTLPDAMSAAGWCPPSEVSYTWLADYVVDGIVSMPEVSAPRGGLMTTTGPALAQGTFGGSSGLDAFGFTQTEAQAIAGTVKTCEVIECPSFQDHRLDAVGYCWKVPLLTQKAFPELVADALRLSSVLYAHKLNKRFIADVVAGSTAITATGALGATTTDTLEALCIVAVRERRWWNLGENAIMEVKLPAFMREVFRADISRRQNMTVEAVTDEQINAQFTARRLAVEYVADFNDLTASGAPVFPANFVALIYPAGTWVKAVEDVVNLSAVYDAASLSVNEYTGIFYEQGIMTFKAGYRSYKVTIPICTAGLVGAAILDCNPLTPNNATPVPA